MDDEARREKQRDATRRYREKLKAAGKPLRPPLTDQERERQREYVRQKRAEAAANGEVIPADTWHLRNPEKHRERVRNYRAKHVERMREVGRADQLRRRSTPWGQITNRLWPLLHDGVWRRSDRKTKYTAALGYSWADLRAHLEAKFEAGMSWDNWGTVWEIDHIKPLSLFQYTSLEDPLFREAWALSNLRPLLAHLNASKGNKHSP